MDRLVIQRTPAGLRPADGPQAAVLELMQGDIAQVVADAVVTAANSALVGGGGVDGAIHRAAGPGLMDQLRALGRGCATGSAVLTGPGHLAERGIRHIVHAVGPVWRNGRSGEPDLLAAAYATACDLAEAAGDRTIAFPAISCGAYGYPVEQAALIALGTVRACLARGQMERATFVLSSGDVLDAFSRALVIVA